MIFLFAGQFFLHLKTLLGLGGSEAYCCKFPQAKLAVLNSHFCLFVFVVAVFCNSLWGYSRVCESSFCS